MVQPPKERMDMKRLGILLSAALLLAASLTTTALAQEDNSGPNCDELDTVGELADAIEQYGAETYDDDDDGVACDSTLAYQYADTGQDEPEPADEPELPARIETGGGYCAEHSCVTADS
jgi:hypothetical protein